MDIISLTQPQNKLVVDIGMGKGRLSIALAKSNAEMIVGADISKEMIGIAKQRAEVAGISEKISMVNCDAEHLPFKDNCFPVVYCIQIFPHLPNPLISMLELSRIAQKNGFVVADAIVVSYFRRILESVYYFKALYPFRLIFHKVLGKPLNRLEYNSTVIVNSFSRRFFLNLYQKAKLQLKITERYAIFLMALAKKI